MGEITIMLTPSGKRESSISQEISALVKEKPNTKHSMNKTNSNFIRFLKNSAASDNILPPGDSTIFATKSVMEFIK